MRDRIVIIGAGECGAHTALHLREHGFEGHIALIGNEALATYERPPLSKHTLTGPTLPPPVSVLTPTRLATMDLETVPTAAAESIDRGSQKVTLADGTSLGYDTLVLATGARARTLPVEGGEHAMTLRTYDDAVALRGWFGRGVRVGVVGGGLIGLEVAASARTAGCEVTVLEVEPRLLSRAVPAALAEVLAGRHAEAGVAIRCSTRVTRLVRGSEGIVIELDDGDVIRCDVVVAGVGAVPNTALAEGAGLDVGNGIVADEFLCTPDPCVYAAGDCSSFPHALFGGRRIRIEAWRNAHDQARAVARNIAGERTPYLDVPWFWSEQFDLCLQVAGLADCATEQIVRLRSDGIEIRFGLDREGRLVSAAGVGPGVSVARDVRLAELMIASGTCPPADALADPAVGLKIIMKSSAPTVR